MTARAYILKVIRIREYLMRTGCSRKNAATMHRAIRRLKVWIDFYPRATDQQVCAYLSRHQAEILELLPGVNCPVHDSLINQLNTLIYGKKSENNQCCRH